MSAHARLGPSNGRWPYCAGSVREEAQYPDIAGEAAIDGTGSHVLLEMCMINNVRAEQYDMQIIGANHHDNPNGWLVAPDRIERVQQGLDYITRRVAELKEQFPGCVVVVESEQHVDPGKSFGRSDWWGTCDISIIAKHPMDGSIYFVEAADYKDGRGYVSEKKNTQLTSYLYGKLAPYLDAGNHPQGCRMTIIQPKTSPSVRYICSTRLSDQYGPFNVKNDAIKLAEAAERTDHPDALLTPGKHCQWCKANPKRGGHCTAATDQSLKTVESMSNNIITTGDSSMFEYIQKAVADPKSLTVEKLGELADAEPGIQEAFNQVKKEIQARIEQGIKVPGWAMLPGNNRKVWNLDEEELVKKLKSRRLKKDDIYPAKLISPAQALALTMLTPDQKAKLEKDLISIVAGKNSLGKVSHEVVEKTSEMLFADVPQWVQDAGVSAEPEISFL